jgi:protein-tyrosine phosphatase
MIRDGIGHQLGVYTGWRQGTDVPGKPLEVMPPDEETIRGVSRFIRALLEANHNVLVHCHNGLNRASLVTGCALVGGGMEPADAVEILRKRRDPNVLNNEVFLEWLLKLQPGDSL